MDNYKTLYDVAAPADFLIKVSQEDDMFIRGTLRATAVQHVFTAHKNVSYLDRMINKCNRIFSPNVESRLNEEPIEFAGKISLQIVLVLPFSCLESVNRLFRRSSIPKSQVFDYKFNVDCHVDYNPELLVQLCGCFINVSPYMGDKPDSVVAPLSTDYLIDNKSILSNYN